MSIFDTFSKRQEKKKNAGKAEVFRYEDIPKKFRVQVVHLWGETLGSCVNVFYRDPRSGWWTEIHRIICKETGRFKLTEDRDPFTQCANFLLNCSDVEALDLIELSFCVIDCGLREYCSQPMSTHSEYLPKQTPDDAIDELNGRFMEHGLGYEFTSGEIVRKDSQFIHAEVVRLAIALLREAKFSGPSEEFLRAHEHFRHGRNKEAIVEALKAFESTMKAICDAKGWKYNATDSAKPLIQVLVDNKLIPPFLTTHLPALATILESGLPTVRNKLAGHGQGATPVEVPAHFVAYALHLAASNIVMLVEAHKAKK